MKLLADENVSGPFVRWLRDEGHDVAWIAELSPGDEDSDVLKIATTEQRVLVTNDLDFGNTSSATAFLLTGSS